MANSTYTSSNISCLLQVTVYTKSGLFYKEFIKMLAVIHLLVDLSCIAAVNSAGRCVPCLLFS